MFEFVGLDGENIGLNGEVYYLVAEYSARQAAGISVYFKEDGNEAVVLCSNGLALVGKLDRTTAFAFIEDTISLDGFCILAGGFREGAEEAEKQLGKLPLVRAAVPMSGSRLKNAFISLFRSSKPGYTWKDLQDDFCSYTLEQLAAEPENLPDEEPEYEDEFQREMVPADAVGEGWAWEQFDDGSGHLQGPNGESLFSYDLAPYNGRGVEYQRYCGSLWDVFWGTFEEFKDFAEKQTVLLNEVKPAE